MKKSLLLITLCLVISFAALAPSTIAGVDELSSIVIDYENGVGTEGRTKDEIVNDLVNDFGLSTNDATFYAKVEILGAQLNDKGIVLDLDDVNSLDSNYVQANLPEIRKRALELDLVALKSLVEQSAAAFIATDDLENIQEFFHSNKQYDIDNDLVTYTLNYADGSAFKSTQYSTVESPKLKNNDLETNATFIPGPWTEDYAFYGSNYTRTDGLTTTSTHVWEYETGLGRARVQDQLRWTYDKSASHPLVFVSDTGSASRAGIVEIKERKRSNHQIGVENGTGNPILQGYTDVVFEATQSFSASFGPFQIGVDGGVEWHQYCIIEIINFDLDQDAFGQYAYAGQFL